MTDNYFHAWTPDTGTAELPAIHRGIPLVECMTAEIFPPAMRPVLSEAPDPRPNLLAKTVRRIAKGAYVTLIGTGFASIGAFAFGGSDVLVQLASLGH